MATTDPVVLLPPSAPLRAVAAPTAPPLLVDGSTRPPLLLLPGSAPALVLTGAVTPPLLVAGAQSTGGGGGSTCPACLEVFKVLFVNTGDVLLLSDGRIATGRY